MCHLLGTENWIFLNPVSCWQIQKYELIETNFRNRCRNLPLSRHFQLSSNQGCRNWGNQVVGCNKAINLKDLYYFLKLCRFHLSCHLTQKKTPSVNINFKKWRGSLKHKKPNTALYSEYDSEYCKLLNLSQTICICRCMWWQWHQTHA